MVRLMRTSWRSLKRERFFALLNLSGLSIGLSCVIAIVCLIKDDLSFDRFHKKGHRIYRLIAETGPKTNTTITSANTSFPLGPALKENFPEIEASVRFRQAYKAVVSVGRDSYKEPDFYFVDPEVFEVFSFSLKKGDPKTALIEPNSVVLTSETAVRLFATEAVLGRTFHYLGSGGPKDLKVTGVLFGLPENTHFSFDYLASFKSLDTEGLPWTGFTSLWTYLLLRDGSDPGVLNAKIPKFIESHIPQNERLSDNETIITGFESLYDIQLYSRLGTQMKPTSDINFIYLLAAIACLVLTLVCFNFIGLSTARALKKTKEVGIRKIAGASRRQLIVQFLGESFLLCAGGTFCAAALLLIFKEPLTALTGRPLHIDLAQPWFLLLLGTVIIVVTLASGFYPAFFLSSFHPAGILQSIKKVSAKGSLSMRKGLVLIQFSIASVMIFGTLLVEEQIQFIRKKNLGAGINQIVYVPSMEKADAFIHELTSYESILSASNSSRLPANEDSFDSRPVKVEGHAEPFQMESFTIDENFLETFDLSLIAGRNLTRQSDTLNSTFLINESAVKFLGWSSTAEALGKRIGWQNGYINGAIVGVVKDFHLASLRAKIGPLIMLNQTSGDAFEFISVKLKTDDNLQDNLRLIEERWRKYEPAGGFELAFAQERFLRLHQEDMRLGNLSKTFALIAILVASLGLFGLTTYIVQEKMKEMAIRKVLGANVVHLLKLLYSNFLEPVILGCILVIPLMVWLSDQWLSGFSYRIQPDWRVYALAFLCTISLAIITVTYKSVEAIFEDPVKSLRNE